MRIGPQSPLVLGSTSPRRRELIASLDVPFVIAPIDVDEGKREGETPSAYLERVVAAKLASALAVRASLSAQAGGLGGVLVADTIVVGPDGALLGKPGSDVESREMIARLEGASHEVRTRFALASEDAGADDSVAQTVTTRVVFRRLTPLEIDAYVASGEGRDKRAPMPCKGAPPLSSRASWGATRTSWAFRFARS